MAQLSNEERIRRIEQAPAEMQAMVAKAFLRDDIDDEDVQYKFNTDSIEELNENGLEGVENINAEATEEDGIGAGFFTIRTKKPYDNKNYIRTATGGWNTCIKGNPMDAHANVLANCVGYASGRFNEIINDAREKTGCTYTNLNCNAENFADRAKKDGLEMGSVPRVGAIGCMWGAGDKAGHVFIVERVDSKSRIYTSESGYGSSRAFWNQIRDNSNGRWGMSGSYSFRCFIYLPADVQKIVDGGLDPIVPTVERDTTKNQLKTIDVMNVRTNIETTSPSLGIVPSGNLYNWYEEKQGKSSKWYAINPEKTQWIAGVNNNGHKYCEIYYAESPKPTPVPPEPKPTPTTELKVGDKVKIIGTGNGSSMGKANTAYGIGWTRQILKIWNGRPYPYQIGNSKGVTTGFYKASALKKL